MNIPSAFSSNTPVRLYRWLKTLFHRLSSALFVAGLRKRRSDKHAMLTGRMNSVEWHYGNRLTSGALLSATRIVAWLCIALQPAVSAQETESAPAASNAYELVTDFFRLPEGRTIGATSGLAIHPEGTSIWVFDRCGSTNCLDSDVAPIMQFDLQGNHLISFGANLFVRPHGISVDRDGNVWVADDVGPGGIDTHSLGKGHQVFKFSPTGELLMTLGTPGVAGDGSNEFNMPSAVVVGPEGNIYVGDGHGGSSNSRIVKFDAAGKFIKAWGRRGSGPGEFYVPHALAFDSLGRLFVGDRGNNRVQIFDRDGNFLDQWNQFGRPSGLYIDNNDRLYVTDSSSTPANNPGFGEGIRIGSVHDGAVVTYIEDPHDDGSQEGVVADAAGNIYGSLTAGMALRKYIPQKNEQSP